MDHSLFRKWLLLIIFNCCSTQNLDYFGVPKTIVRGPGIELERLSIADPNFSTSPRWLVVSGRQIIPGSVYRVAVQNLGRGIRSEDLPMTFRAAITHNNQQVTFGKVLVQPDDLSSILLQIPDTSVQGNWKLRIEGREGMAQLPVFKNSTVLKFIPNFLTILIQTSRPVYNAGQTVRFRAVMLTRDLKPYEEPVEIYVIDPNGRVMRRWPSRQTGDGVVNLSFQLPDFPLLGNWTIKVQARQQVQNQTILVEQYFKPRFEVFVRLPPTFNVADELVEGVIVANMTNWRYVYGNCSIRLQLATNNDYPIPTAFETTYEIHMGNFSGHYAFHLPMYTVASRAGNLEDVVIRVHATIVEGFEKHVQSGWALARIVRDNAKVSFLGDQPLFFRPGMPITVHVLASFTDDHPISDEQLEDAVLTVTFTSSQVHQVVLNGTTLIKEGAVAMCTFNVPEEASSLEVSARFVSGSGLSAAASISGVTHHSPRNRHLQIETSTFNAIPGENMVFHVRNNFFITHFNYIIVSNGLIVYSGREYINDINVPTVTTFAIPASAEMSPVAKVLVWVLDQDKEVVAHSLAIPINPLGRHKVNLRWNEHKDHTGGSAEVKFIGEKGSFFAASAVWEETHLMDAGNNINKARVLLHMMGLTKNYNHINLTREEAEDVYYGAIPHIRRATTRSRDGSGSNVRFFPTTIAGPDAPTTFNFSEVVLFTDAMVLYHPSKASNAPTCDDSDEDLLQCLTGSCYQLSQRCDGISQCPDSSDEAGCPVDVDPMRNFRVYRLNRLYRFYDQEVGDFAWQDIRGIGKEINVFSIPKRPQNWVFSFYAVGKESGLGIYEPNVHFDSAGPFTLKIDGPRVATRWEQVSLTVAIFNFHFETVGVLITLPRSDDYQSIVVEDNGVVESYNPRRVEGTFQHIVWLPPDSSTDVHIPIIFKRLGIVEVTVVGATQMQKDSDTIEIDVGPEGANVGQHVSILFDLKDRALVYEFLDIGLDESPIIPYSLERNYLYGSTAASASITGDVVGAAFPEIPVNEGNLLGFSVMGAETSVFSFASNIWSLHYLRLTNQLNEETTFKVLNTANVYYAELARYQNPSGGFSNWIGSEESVWLTAYSLRNLWIANFQDWENHVYIDQEIIQQGVEYLLQWQTDIGSFQETPWYLHPLDPKVDPRVRNTTFSSGIFQNVSLTAHVVIALESVLSGLEGDLHNKANLAKQRAVSYLERLIDTMHDPYDLAITTWALTKSDSKEKDYAFNALDKLKRVVGDRIYWSRGEIAFHELVSENSQKSYLQAKSDNVWDAHSVETTAYALLVYIKQGGIGIIQENIVRFLNSMREMNTGMIASIDSLVAKEALVEYSYRARIRAITEMRVSIEPSASPNISYEYTLDSSNLAAIEVFDLDNPFGHITVTGRGSGQALLQLDFSYGVDIEERLDYPPVEAFKIDIFTQFTGRNNSLITITSCQQWIYTEEADTSGLTVVRIPLPTGYHVMQDVLLQLVEERTIRNLRWAYVTDKSVHFFFNKLDTEPVCFTYQLHRWYPVANHTRFSLAMVYELYQPERFRMQLFETYPLYVLDICEVCGSYQCPYCPFYNGAPIAVNQQYLSMIIILNIFYAILYKRSS